MKAKLKKQILKMLSHNLSMFRNIHTESFMCPTCMNIIPIKEIGKISDAHIIPKSAGGKLKTFICKDCNSKFGSKQDKWFGDVINIANSPNQSVFSTAIKDKYFEIDGIRYNGTWEKEQNSNMSLLIYANRNAPEKNDFIQKKLDKKPSGIEIDIPMPILRNQQLIDVGFLTAAYLMWFGLMGYSWCLQEHLDAVRQQIKNPDKKIITAKYLLKIKNANWEPWIGLVNLMGNTVPAFGFKGYLLVLPPFYMPNYYYESLGNVNGKKINSGDIKPFELPKMASYGPPVAILFERRLIIFSKPTEKAMKHLCPVLFTNESNEGRILHETPKKEFEKLKKEKNAIYTKIDL